MPEQPLVTLVITPRERYAVAQRALDSIFANTSGAYELIYVAGGAPTSIASHLATTCAERGHEFISRPEFLAPNAARNLGLARATTRYVVFLDNDVVVEPGWLDALVRCAEEEQADLVSPLCLIGEPGERNVHSFGGKLAVEKRDGKLVLQEHHHCGPICLRTDPRRLVRIESDYAEFHCSFVRRSVLERMGPFDENILGAAEHVDLALHLQASRGRGFAEPEAVVSYLPSSYTIGDLDTYAPRWSDDWHFPTMRHIAHKWSLCPSSPLFHDYRSSLAELQERCLLPRRVPFLPERIDQIPVAQTIVQLLDQMEALGYPLEARLKARDAYMVAGQTLGSGFRASGRTFVAHLAGTASILAAFGANPAVIAASILHATYQHGRFPSAFEGSISSIRRWMQRRVGAAVEDLVYQYSRLQLHETGSYTAGQVDNMPIPLAHAVLIRIANGIEDRIAGDHRYFDSAQWLSASNAQIEQWMPCFTAVADRLGVGGMASILREAVERAQPLPMETGLQAARPLNYAIEVESGDLRGLNGRSLLGSPSDRTDTQPSKSTEQNGNGQPHRCRVDLRALHALNGGVVSRDTEGFTVVSDPHPWGYSARLSAPESFKGPATLEISLVAERGTMGILVLERGSSVYKVAPEQSVSASAVPVTVRFEMEAIEEAGEIIFRPWPSDQEGPARVRVLAVNALLKSKPDAAATKRRRPWFFR